MIRPFTVRVNCQIRGSTSIRKGLREEDTPFLVSSNSIIASENVSGRVSGENLESLREAVFTNPEGSQSGGVPILPIRSGPNFANPEGSHFGQSEGVPILPIRSGPNFANPEGSHFGQSGGVSFCQSGSVQILPIRRGPVFTNPEGYCFVKT